MIKGTDNIHDAIEKVAGSGRAAVGGAAGALLGGIAGMDDKEGPWKGFGRGALTGAAIGGSAGALSKLPGAPGGKNNSAGQKTIGTMPTIRNNRRRPSFDVDRSDR